MAQRAGVVKVAFLAGPAADVRADIGRVNQRGVRRRIGRPHPADLGILLPAGYGRPSVAASASAARVATARLRCPASREASNADPDLAKRDLGDRALELVPFGSVGTPRPDPDAMRAEAPVTDPFTGPDDGGHIRQFAEARSQYPA